MKSPTKILIIRFSSFGDIIFTLSIVPALKKHFGKDTQIDWLLRDDMKSILASERSLNQVWSFDRKSGLKGLINLSRQLRLEEYDIVYDAHTNIRSLIVRTVVGFLSSSQVIVRSKERLKRFLLFKLRMNLFPRPFRAMVSFLEPLQKELGIRESLETFEWDTSSCSVDTARKITLVPCTAWPMKSWPKDYWMKLVEVLSDYQFIVLGGPGDTICDEIAKVAPDRVISYAGKLSLNESCQVIARSEYVVTADTGLAQVADLTGKSGLTMIGPTAFGYPSMGTMEVVEQEMSCRPCTKDGRGSCSQKVYQQCMVGISPESIAQRVREHFK